MPNHVMNRLHFDTDEETAKAILAFIQKDNDGENEKYGPGTFDFNKLVPMPTEYLKTGEWYNWRWNNWGTKWNAYEEEYDGGNTISFLTAWAPPHEVIEALSEQFPGVYFTHRWAEEEIGVDVGQREYLNGVCVGDIEPEGEAEAIAINGQRLVAGTDYTENNGRSITLLSYTPKDNDSLIFIAVKR